VKSRGPVDEARLGPSREVVFGPSDEERTTAEIIRIAQRILNQRTGTMHYRNGRVAKNGDRVVKLEGGKVVSYGVLHSATPGNDYCNGNIAIIQAPNDYACMCDCLHIDDVAEILAEKGLDKRPSGK
jgi:hypothetical protein